MLAATTAFLVFGAGTAWAQTEYGSWKAPSVGGKYFFQARSFTDDTNNVGGGEDEVTNYDSAPGGYMGVAGYTYKESGALCHSTSVRYNPSAAKEWSVQAPSTGCGAGYYQGQNYYSFYEYTTGNYKTGLAPRAPLLYF